MRVWAIAMLGVSVMGCGPKVEQSSASGDGGGESGDGPSETSVDLPAIWQGSIEENYSGVPSVRLASYRVVECGDGYVGPEPRCAVPANWTVEFEVPSGIAVPGVYASEELAATATVHGPPRDGDDDDCGAILGAASPFTVELDALTEDTVSGSIVDFQTGIGSDDTLVSGPFVAGYCR